MEFNVPEGATPINDSSFLKLAWVQNQGDLNRAEAENIASAQKKYLKKASLKSINWFNPESLQNVHKEMFGTVWDWAGKFRKEVTSIGVKPYMIHSRLIDLCDEVNYWLRSL